jgi:hypothetical protein
MTEKPTDTTLLVRCLCGCSIYSSEEEPTLFLERCILHDSAPGLLAACGRAEQTIRNLANGGWLTGNGQLIALNEAANLRKAIAKAKGKRVTP